jgi:hypothetical protein
MFGLFLALCWVLTPLAASAAGDVEAQLHAMQERMDQLEARLDSTTDQLAEANQKLGEQHTMIERAAKTEPNSGAIAFLESLEIGGWLATDYWYNFNHPSNERTVDGNTGTVGQSNPFSPDSNQFSFGQLWLTVERPIDEENRAGFATEIALGKAAGLLPNGNTPEGGRAGGNNLYVASAYAQYLTPWGITLKAGKFGTLLGAEVAQAPMNFNISRGLVYNLLQPIDHTGLLASGELPAEGWDWAFGVVNDVFETQPVYNNGKAMLGHVGYSTETWSANLNGIWGTDTPGSSSSKLGIIDVVLTWDPAERISLWLNADYVLDDNSRERNSSAYGLAVAGRYAWSDKLGTALRLEYVKDDRAAFGFPDDAQIWSITATTDYELTEHLIVKGEIRHDGGTVRRNSDHLFIDSDDEVPGIFTNPNQTLFGAQVIYTF